MMVSGLAHLLCVLAFAVSTAIGNEDAKRLLDDLLNNYDNVVRPVSTPKDKINLKLGLKLSQIADIDERNQIMTTNVWVRHEWFDQKLRWDPLQYGNITKVNIPSTNIWLADIVLYNNADGDYHITTKTKATVHYNGKIVWEPPMIYKSYCAINIEYYPFDIQDCYMKFGTWTFNGEQIDLEHINQENSVAAPSAIDEKNIRKDGSSNALYTVNMGIDMTDYYDSVEWDILSIPAQKNIKYYECCPEPYYDIYFNITIRRKTLFYTVNLIIPCVNISFLSVLVFYLPSDSGEKLTLGISILVALLVFYLLLIELIPPTSLVIPLLGKYLLFTLILVNLSILLTIFILNLHHRKPNTHKMPFWMKRVVIEILPKMLMIERPKVDELNMRGKQTNTMAAAAAAAAAKHNSNQKSDYHISYALQNAANSSHHKNKRAFMLTPSLSFTSSAYSLGNVHDANRIANNFVYDQPITSKKVSFGHNESIHNSLPRAYDDNDNNYGDNDDDNDDDNSNPLENTYASTLPKVRHRNKLHMYAKSSNSNEREYLVNMNRYRPSKPKSASQYYPKTITDALEGIKYINQQMKKDNIEQEEIDDWKYASMVIDRLLLWIFTSACLMGTFGILLQAPSIYDEREALGKMNRTL